MIRSKLKLYSLGIAVNDKELDSSELIIYPVEQLPLEDGKLGGVDPLVTNKSDSFDKQASVTVERENTITAKWLPIYGSNRVTAPDIIKNETVLILRYEDTDEFYWVDAINEMGLRRRETVLWLFGNTGIYEENLDLENSYWVRVSSHGKKIQLHTSDNDEELCTYDITIDTAAGYFEIKDGRGNYIKLDSAEDTLYANIIKDIKVTNGRDITVENGRDIVVQNGNNISVENAKDVNINNGGNITVDNSGDTSITNGGNVSLTVEGETSITSTGAVAIESTASVDVTAPDVKVNGSASIALAAPAISLSGAISMSAPGGVGMSADAGKMSMGTAAADIPTIISELTAAVTALQVATFHGDMPISGSSAGVLADIQAKIDSLI